PINRGENSFTFSQEGQNSVTRVIKNNPPPQPPPPETMPQPVVRNVLPAAAEYARAGTTLTLAATAPSGATVTAQIGEKIISLSQTSNANLISTNETIFAARFTGNFLLLENFIDYENPQREADPTAIISLGKPVYTMTWNGKTATATAAEIFQIGTEANFFAEITSDNTWVFPGATTTGGSHWTLSRGQRDRVAAISGNWTRLSSGGWVENTNVRTYRDDKIVPTNALGFFSEGMYIAGDFDDKIVWEIPFSPVALAEFDGTTLIFSLGLQQKVSPIFVNIPDTIFSKIDIGTHKGSPAYFFTLRNGENLEGFYTEYENGKLNLILRKRKNLSPGNYPFAGFTFVIDAGHGGNDSGAVGPMGAAMSESMLVLTHAKMLRERLEKLGAKVVLVRDSADRRFELLDRVVANRAAKPDMFISLHTNATAETTNATNVHGFTVWYRNENSRPAATVFMDSMRNVNPLSNRNNSPNHANFFVCRPSWSPAILLEASFTNNIRDFSWMINERAQVDYAWGIVNALLKYYR
ncbi:MAG: N-acetylmuramoyl-L-alanine amidase, partial [Defluviitaleaceae bacterium]|nr:N-acetylmuramoyl-L-alanine amidase [Defluviitaleaceae bacterium]